MTKELTARDQADREVGDTFEGEKFLAPGTGNGVDVWGPDDQEVVHSTIIIERLAFSSGMTDLNDSAFFRVPATGTYQYVWRDCQASASQGSRTTYLAQVRTGASGGGSLVSSHTLNLDGTPGNSATVTYASVAGTMDLSEGTNYYMFGDRNTGGLNAGNRWTLELTLV